MSDENKWIQKKEDKKESKWIKKKDKKESTWIKKKEKKKEWITKKEKKKSWITKKDNTDKKRPQGGWLD